MWRVNGSSGAWLRAGLVLVLAAWVAGCEENVVQPDAHRYPFSMWGIVNPQADTQFVRVFPIERTLDPAPPAPLDAAFVSTDLDTGERRVWRDSVFVDSTGSAAHVFYAPFRAAYEHRYRLEITRSDGAASWVEVTTPGEVRATVAPPEQRGGRTILPAFLQGTQPRLLRTDFEVFFAYVTGYLGTPPFLTPVCHYVHFNIPYDDRVRRAADGWAVDIDFTEAFALVRRWALDRGDAVDADPPLILYGVDVHAVIANEAWRAPDDVFDPDVLVQPGAMENVQNGFGFVGSGYRLTRTWSLDEDFVRETGFIPGGSCERGEESVVRYVPE